MGNDMGKKVYRNVFKEIGIPEEEITKRLEDTFYEIFYGEDKLFHIVDDMGYMEDTGNHDVRTEGMSYAMMMCVQMNRKEEFDRIWKWAKTYMFLTSGVNAGYFAWSMHTDGSKNSDGPAPDGEEFFAMALFFASHRWGDGEGIFAYSLEAKELLKTCIHKGEDGIGNSMWDRENHLIKFVPGLDFTDPSYHLPHFYELFSMWAYEEDRQFWKDAAKASREFLKKACHSETGLCADFTEYDGSSLKRWKEFFGDHDFYFSDSYRTIANIGLDYEWFVKDIPSWKEWYEEIATKLQKFIGETMADNPYQVYYVDGTVAEEEIMHPLAMLSGIAQASLAAKGENAYEFVKKFFYSPLRTGDRRYYDNCLYFFAMLSLSGNYRIW